MAITPKIQRPKGADTPVVAAGAPFSVRLDSDLAQEHGTLSISVANAPRQFALAAGGAEAPAHAVFVDEPMTVHIHGWGDANDRGKELVVSVRSTGEPITDSALL